MQPVLLEDILTYHFLSNPRWSPDGKRAAFVASNANEDRDGYESRLWLYENGAVRQLTALGQEKTFVWQDAHTLLFPAVRAEKERKRRESGEAFTSFYRLDVNGGEAQPAFTLPVAVERIQPFGAGYALVAALDANRPDDYLLSDEERKKAMEERKDEKDYEVLDEISYWHNGAGFINKKRSALFLCGADGSGLKRVTAPLESVGAWRVCEQEVLFDAVVKDTKLSFRAFRLFSLTADGECRLIARSDTMGVSDIQAVNGQIWLMGTEGKRHGLNENDWVYRVNRADGSLEIVRQEECDMYNSVGSDCRLGGGEERIACGDSLYYIATREGNAVLYRMDMQGETRRVIDRPGSIDCIALQENAEEILLVALYDMKLQELYAYRPDTQALRQITHFNDEALAGRYVAQPEPISVRSEGWEIGGWVLKPRDYDPSKKYPAVFDIHGGPKTVYGPVFYHEMQLWASMGYFVFFCNPKGSDGRDNKFADIFGHYGETDYRNLMDFADAVLAAWPQIDPARVCETGGSYGGFMTNWIIGHTDRFCCAASQRSISNWLSFYGTSDIGWYFAPDQCRGDVFASPETLWRQSPLKYAASVKTPTLFIHSDQDYRCPLEQGLQMYTALADHGVPTRLCLFHGETHELSRSGMPKHRIRRLREITEWFEKYANT